MTVYTLTVDPEAHSPPFASAKPEASVNGVSQDCPLVSHPMSTSLANPVDSALKI